MEDSDADAVVRSPEDGFTYVVTPLKVDEPFGELLRFVVAQESGTIASSPVKYAQTRRLQYPLLILLIETDVG